MDQVQEQAFHRKGKANKLMKDIQSHQDSENVNYNNISYPADWHTFKKSDNTKCW